jgi:glycosyltransferase involved in cell wall biosynthesis
VNILYATNVRIPSERAHGRQIAHVCRALWQLGHGVEVVAPYRENVVEQDFWTYEHLSKDVKLTYIGTVDYIAKHWPGALKLWSMNRMLRREMPAVIGEREPDVVYTRSPALLPALLKTGVPVVLELHQLPRVARHLFVEECNACARVACLTSPMRDALLRWGVEASKLIVEGDAVDLDRFENLPSPAKARSKWNLKTDRLVVGYVGRLTTLGQETGVATLLQALAAAKGSKRFFGFVVGGPEADKARYEKTAKKLGLTEDDVLFAGEIPAVDVPASLRACDVLAMPFPDLPHYRTHMSPLKMFEYMAADRPLLTTDLPTVRDVLDEKTAVFCRPGDPADFLQALRWIADHPDDAAKRAAAAAALVKRHTWQERMSRILDGVSLRSA